MKAYRYIGGSGIQIIQEDPNEAIVNYFYVDPNVRGRGVGARLMKATCKDADREGITLYLDPSPFSAFDHETEQVYLPTLNYKQLCAFYRKFGFRFIPHSETMKRVPK